MKRKFVFAATIAVTAVTGGLYGQRSHSVNGDSDALLANAEALAEVENDNPMWSIDPYNCTISGELAAKLGLTLKTDAELSISGARDCIAGGSSLCKPINCVDIYQALK